MLTVERTQEQNLDDLIEVCGEVKDDLKILKSNEKKYTDSIKKLMKESVKEIGGKRSYTVDAYTAVLYQQDKSSMNEEKLIQFLKQNGLSKGIVRRKEYVDGDALEDAIYNDKIPEKLLVEMDSCKEKKFVDVLKITKKKEK